MLAENPDLTSDKPEYVTDTTVQVGGPIKRDKMWFFTSFQYLPPEDHAVRIPAARRAHRRWGRPPAVEKSPRFIAKPTIRLGQADQLTGFIEYRQLHRRRRRRGLERGAGGDDAPDRTRGRMERELHEGPLNASAVFDVKYSGY